MRISKKDVEQIKKELKDNFFSESDICIIYRIDKKVLNKIKNLDLEKREVVK